jgi:hypothetical protein
MEFSCNMFSKNREKSAEQGLFFRHDVTMAPGDSARFAGNVFFHRDAVSIYPVTLTADNAAMKNWDIITIRGLVE